jgi:type II secretory pathway component PulK
LAVLAAPVFKISRQRITKMPTPITNNAPEVQYQEDFFAYSTQVITVTANASQSANIQIEADSYFKWIKGTFLHM